MANPEHLAILKQGVKAWNEWRAANPDEWPELSGANLTGANLRFMNLSGADLRKAVLYDAQLTKVDLHEADLREVNMVKAILHEADLSRADLRKAMLTGAYLGNVDLSRADLRGARLDFAYLNWANLRAANLSEADLSETNLSKADLTEADLQGANLERTQLVETKLRRANLAGCRIYGISAWNVNLEEAAQSGLVVTPRSEVEITVDDLEVAQFIYVMLDNEKVRRVIDTITSKAVLILGRFTERRPVLEAITTEVRRHDLLPITFDFERPTDRDFSETILTLAGMSRFIIADITKPSSVALELQLVVPNLMIPFVPLIQEPDKPFAMFQDLWKKHGDWVLEPLFYDSVEQLLRVFDRAVLKPANERRAVLQAKKAEEPVTRYAKDYE